MKNQVLVTVDCYINAASALAQPKLRQIRSLIQTAAPQALEVISYRIPAYKHNGRVLVYFGAFKDHLGFFPTGSGVAAFKAKLKAYKTSKGTIQFPYDRPLPTQLITDIVTFRLQEVTTKKDTI